MDDYYTGKGYPETVNTTGPIPGLSYFQAIEKVVEIKDGLLFYPAFTGFFSTDALHESVMKEILVLFHFITPKSANQLPVKSDDRTVYRCMAAGLPAA